ncbi:MAG: GIY-YIG nuclease family protein [Chitinophagaceae bacterium]
MAAVYILFSPSANKYYTGSCKDITERLEQHLSESISGAFTVIAKDWMLYLLISDLEYKQARLIEGHIKKMKSRIFIENLKKYPELVLKLRNTYR